MKKIYGIVLGQCTPSLQSETKGFPEHEKKSEDCDYLWPMEELKKIMEGVDVKTSPMLCLI